MVRYDLEELDLIPSIELESTRDIRGPRSPKSTAFSRGFKAAAGFTRIPTDLGV